MKFFVNFESLNAKWNVRQVENVCGKFRVSRHGLFQENNSRKTTFPSIIRNPYSLYNFVFSMS